MMMMMMTTMMMMMLGECMRSGEAVGCIHIFHPVTAYIVIIIIVIVIEHLFLIKHQKLSTNHHQHSLPHSNHPSSRYEEW